MPERPDSTNAKQLESPPINFNASTILREAKTIEVIAPLETGVARGLTGLYPTKELVECLIYIVAHHLHGLAEDDFGFGKSGAILGCHLVLVEPTDMTPLKFPGQLSIFQTHVVPVPAHAKYLYQQLFLCWRGIQTVLERLELHQLIQKAVSVRLPYLFRVRRTFNGYSPLLANKNAQPVNPEHTQYIVLKRRNQYRLISPCLKAGVLRRRGIILMNDAAQDVPSTNRSCMSVSWSRQRRLLGQTLVGPRGVVMRYIT